MTQTRRSIGYRLAPTRLGDRIQDIAARELGDAGRWPELVAYNGLAPPYVVDSLGEIEESGDAGTVILTGTSIKIPANQPPNAVSDPEDIFGTDLLLTEGMLTAGEDGDLALVSDMANLKQALTIRLGTRLRELTWHPDYGNPIFDMVGEHGTPVNNQLARAYGERTLRSDPRIARVERITADFAGDQTVVEAEAIDRDGRPLPVEA